mmetsp:Transcript_7090/g.7346  ORF Transcript_7090/g.7346 Transcript_7090/m.7346 type:complete len:847 (-) Transcript_7090:79-2619(-)
MANLFQYYNRVTSNTQNAKANNASAPTFEDLSIDDNLPVLDRLVRYTQSAIGLQRLVHVKMLADVAATVGFNATKDNIIPLLSPLSKDSEPAVRQHLCEQLIPLSKFCTQYGGSDGYRILLERLLPTCARELVYEKVEVRQSACVTMVALAKHVKPEDIGKDVLTIVLRLAHEDENEEMRMTACELLNLLAEQLGQELCQQFVIPEMVSLAEDPNFRVRKATALNFQNICKVGGEHELFERLMPAFVRLSKDDMYRVRRACGESLAKISQHVNDDIRSGVLVEIFLRLAQDMSKLVKQSVLQQSGMFIATLPPKMINDVILTHFGSLATGATGDTTVDAELRHHCAHTFPAVLYTVGAGRWTEVREIYHKLVQCQNFNVRVTLALSLHEIAKILGPGRAEEELLSVFEDMIQDVEAVRLGVLRHLADFLRLLSQPCRISYLPLLNDILHSTSQFNWRLRQTLAAQLPELMTLPPPHNVYNTLFPLAMTLLQDPVAQVRQETFKGVAKMLIVLQGHAVSDTDADEMDVEGQQTRELPPTATGRLSPLMLSTPSRLQLGEQYVTAVARAINALTFGDTFQQRQLWVELCRRLVQDLPQELFEQHFLEGLIRLTSDSVLNVRVAVAMVYGGWEPEDLAPWETPSPLPEGSACTGPKQRPSPWTYLMKRQDVQECVKRLAQDDRDVYNWVKNLQPMFPDLEIKSIPCRGRKVAPGGVTPVCLSSVVAEGASIAVEPIRSAIGSSSLSQTQSDANARVNMSPSKFVSIEEVKVELDSKPSDIMDTSIGVDSNIVSSASVTQQQDSFTGAENSLETSIEKTLEENSGCKSPSGSSLDVEPAVGVTEMALDES